MAKHDNRALSQNENDGRPKNFPPYARAIYLVDGNRTPFLKARGKPGPFTASDLAVACCRALLARQPFAPPVLDEIVAGCVLPSSDEANIARIIGLRLGCGNNVPGWTVQRNCGSGMQALDTAAQDIAAGRAELVLAGGTEAMSHAPVLYSKGMIEWLADWNSARSVGQRAKLITKFRLSFLSPIFALLNGLSDPVVGLSMGQTAEQLAYQFHLTREEIDQYALSSHQRLAAAEDQGYLSEIVTLYDKKGNYYQHDDGLRRETTLEKLASLRPFFDKPFGMVTAGNSSQITDGAAFLLLASEDAVKRYNLPVMARIVDVQWASLDPKIMGLGPVYASTPILKRQGFQLSDIDYWEINEAFAAQVLSCLRAWENPEFCRTELGLPQALGSLDRARLNIDGGAVALGHPIGTSGARVVLHLLHVLRRNNAKRGIATMCIGGGQGGAMLIENMAEGV